ncbi:MAG: hypothetical protein IIC51_11395 [Planctomycetes bacterium]|nr:hypothetical protein [Planctomycetota bacterium]
MSITGRDSSAATLDVESEIYPFTLNDVQILPVGQPAAWLDIKRQGDSVVLRPHGPMPKRCTIRPAALFSQDRGFPDVSTVMGRLTFPRGSTSKQSYRAYTCDPQRGLRELFFPVEAMPDEGEVEVRMRSTFEHNRAFARGIAVSNYRDELAGVSWGNLRFRLADGTRDVALDPTKEYPDDLQRCKSVEEFISLLEDVSRT